MYIDTQSQDVQVGFTMYVEHTIGSELFLESVIWFVNISDIFSKLFIFDKVKVMFKGKKTEKENPILFWHLLNNVKVSTV